MKLSSGVDLIDIHRMESAVQRHGERFLKRIFTQQELSEVGHNLSSLAVRFAAKEAASKALKTGIGEVGWHDLEIIRGPDNEPELQLTGNAAILARRQGLQTWSVSLSHTHTHAIAMVVAIGS